MRWTVKRDQKAANPDDCFHPYSGTSKAATSREERVDVVEDGSLVVSLGEARQGDIFFITVAAR